jgi:pyruvate-formate lyase
MERHRHSTIRIPTLDEAITLSLPPEIESLRAETLRLHKDENLYWELDVDVVRAVTDAWTTHGRDEDRQLWCARQFATRLATLPIELDDGEIIVGRPLVREVSDEDHATIEELHANAPDFPKCPGGDLGHFHPNYETVFELGVGGLLDEIATHRDALDADDPKHAFYDACERAMLGFQSFILRVADACTDRATREDNDAWRELATRCEWLATDPPTTFHDACQLMYLVMIACWVGEDHVMTTYGRLDRTLARFYDADLDAGRITPQRAMELIAMLFIQLNRICPIGISDGVIVGGRDEHGHDTTNTLTYLVLAARRATWLRNPSVGIAWHREMPEELMRFAMDMLATGIGCPAFFNDEIITDALGDHDVTPADACNYMNSTCVEIKPAGTSHIWVATEYVNTPKALLEVMRREANGECDPAQTSDELEDRLRDVIHKQVSATARDLDALWTQRSETWAMPFASCIVDDCLARGIDHDRGGTRYAWAENSFVGLANLTDALVTVDELVYQNRETTLAELYAICESNFEDHEPLRQRILNTLPSYGNDDARADAIASRFADFFCSVTESCTVADHRYVPGFFCSQFHAWLGYDTGATPDGRLAETALANGAGAYQGREHAGPTASALSTTKWSHHRTLGGLVHNVRFGASTFATEDSRLAARSVIETYLTRGGFEIQVNVVSADTLRDAKEHPEDYRDLLVRVAGYTNYFTSLLESLQDDVIARTEFDA